MEKLDLRLMDPVFVLGYGQGTVTRVLPDGGFIVNVPGRGERHYTVFGTLGAGQDRRLYYHDPIIREPPKDPAFWRAWRRICLSVYESLDSLYRQGDAPPEGPDDPS
jgi:hypothetical protein